MGNQSSSTLFFAIVVTYSALALHLISKAQQISLIWPSFDTKKNDFLCPGAATDPWNVVIFFNISNPYVLH